MTNFKPTRPAPLPYRGAPLTAQDIFLQQARFDEQFFPRPEVTHSEEVMKKELPSGKWSPAVKYVWGFNLIKSVLPL